MICGQPPFCDEAGGFPALVRCFLHSASSSVPLAPLPGSHGHLPENLGRQGFDEHSGERGDRDR